MPMELRKLQVTGGSTHVVSLPKKWVDRNRLGRSDTVAIHEEPDGSLLLIPHSEARTPTRTLTVQLPDLPKGEDVVRRLVGAYLAGADEILVKASGNRMDPKIRQQIRDVTRDLVGVEILEESGSSMTLQDLVGVSDMDLRKTLTRMQRIARIMYDDALTALRERDAKLAQEVAARDDELDRLLWMVSKQMHALLEQPRLAAKLNVPPAEALNFFLVARALERMGDHATKIATNVGSLGDQKVPDAVVKGLLDHADTVRKVWDEAFSSLKKVDFDLACQTADHGQGAAKWRASFPNLLRNLPHEVVGPLTLVADSIDRVRGYAVDVAEVAMNHTFQQQLEGGSPTGASGRRGGAASGGG
ncbi:MAG TPA: phosphate uptake regulator PhoU [Candidatus Thermoplasmatota archaeon]|nr:phosphate uptake regulator PhoU [Candidatus Thermoplasmatota archaeon]